MGVEGRLRREGICVYLSPVVQQKPTQHCGAIILQSKINLKNLLILKEVIQFRFYI